MAAALSSHDENDCYFDLALVYDTFLGADVPVTNKQAVVEAVTKLQPYLEKYTAWAVPAHPCELFVVNVQSKLSIFRAFCVRVVAGQLPTILFKQMRCSNTA